MHPVLILIPAAALMLGPKLWVVHLLRRYNQREEALPGTAGELARQWLEQHQLQGYQVEITDLGDHYDPDSKTVRLTRDKCDGKSLSALTTAAHEVAHALQDAEGYAPFVWRNRLNKLASATGQLGLVVLISVPAAALLTRRPIPPVLVGAAVFTMLGSALVAQLIALVSELDASFKRALPLLQGGYISDSQVAQAKQILWASSFTYAAASLTSVLFIWPWLGRPRAVALQETPGPGAIPRQRLSRGRTLRRKAMPRSSESPGRRGSTRPHPLVRGIGKPLIRAWLRLAMACR